MCNDAQQRSTNYKKETKKKSPESTNLRFFFLKSGTQRAQATKETKKMESN
jgi:hypothetical protein